MAPLTQNRRLRSPAHHGCGHDEKDLALNVAARSKHRHLWLTGGAFDNECGTVDHKRRAPGRGRGPLKRGHKRAADARPLSHDRGPPLREAGRAHRAHRALLRHPHKRGEWRVPCDDHLLQDRRTMRQDLSVVTRVARKRGNSDDVRDPRDEGPPRQVG